MAKCDTNSINTESLPLKSTAPNIPGFGIPQSPVGSIPTYPTNFPEDLFALLNDLKVNLPPGVINAPLSANSGKQVLDAVLKITDKLTPFLLVYKFILPILNIVVCIIEVLCAIPRPFKMVKALKRLFRRCLPDFLSLFPAFALPSLIISLANVILTLLEYFSNLFQSLFELLTKNIALYKKAIETRDRNSLEAAKNKFAQILCSFQNFFVVLFPIASIFQTIKDIFNALSLKSPCKPGGGSDCCDSEVCPQFVKRDSITGTFKLFYNNKSSAVNGSIVSKTRDESWQMIDTRKETPIDQAFSNMYNAYDITSSPKPTFFPDKTFTEDSALDKIPYLLDLDVFYDPSLFGRSGDARNIKIKNVFLSKIAQSYYLDKNNSKISYKNGVLPLIGGQAYEQDGSPIIINNEIATINSLFHKDEEFYPTNQRPTNQIEINGTYTFNIVHESLVEYNLISMGCIPEIALDSAFLDNALTTDYNVIQNVLNSIKIPDFAKLNDCISIGFDKFRQNITIDGISEFQSLSSACISNAINETTNVINDLLPFVTDVYKSDFVLEPRIQFVNKNVTIKVYLRDKSSTNIMQGAPTSFGGVIASKIKVFATTENSYLTPVFNSDTLSFDINITASQAKNGNVTVSYNESFISTISFPDDLTQSPSITIKSLPYVFVDTNVNNGNDIGNGEAERRDETDLTNG